MKFSTNSNNKIILQQKAPLRKPFTDSKSSTSSGYTERKSRAAQEEREKMRQLVRIVVVAKHFQLFKLFIVYIGE